MTLAHDIDPPDETAASLGRIIRTARIDRGLSQAGLAAAIGVGVRSVRNWEHGDVDPSAGILPALGHTLGVQFVTGPEGWRIGDAPPDVPRVVVIVVTSADEAVDVVRRIQQGLDPQG